MAISPSRQTFREKAKLGNLVPVWRKILADHETPVSAYERVRAYLRRKEHASHTYLLESVEGGENIGRYSYIGGTPRSILRADGRHVEISTAGAAVEVLDNVDPLDALKQHMAQYVPVKDDALETRFVGGAVGFLGYDLVTQFEPRVPSIGNNDIGSPDIPEMLFMVTDGLIIFDGVKHNLIVVANAHVANDVDLAYDQALAQINALCEALKTPVERMLIDVPENIQPLEPKSNTTPEEFARMVGRAKAYIHAGDAVQTVLSQRFEVENEADSLDVYRALRTINPSPYMFCLDLGKAAIVGTSPEIHVRCEGKKVEIRPIAGTRLRGATPEEDAALEAELLADPKECAEHVMLVDLGRNDIGRVCDYHTVKVNDLMVIERYSHVMHIVSDVTGTLAPEHDEYDVMRACFPAGTVSGAPKVRAMEIIAELEKHRRGPYAGAVGYFNFNGDFDSAITIRTVILAGGKAYVQAGAGVVADSVPLNEYEETRNKAHGMMKALALARMYHTARMESQDARNAKR